MRSGSLESNILNHFHAFEFLFNSGCIVSVNFQDQRVVMLYTAVKLQHPAIPFQSDLFTGKSDYREIKFFSIVPVQLMYIYGHPFSIKSCAVMRILREFILSQNSANCDKVNSNTSTVLHGPVQI